MGYSASSSQAGQNCPLDEPLTLSYCPIMRKLLPRYWGYLALGLVILGWVTHTAGYAVILILSIAALVYFLVQAPLTCGADIRKGDHCRNNSHGLLLGCWIRQHKWQRARDIFVSRKWQNVIRDLAGSPKDILGTIGGLVSIVSLFVALPLLIR